MDQKGEEMGQKEKLIVAVLGGNECTSETGKIAYKTGMEIAKAGFHLLCGGLGGVMEYASKGAKKAGGLTIGILPGESKKAANKYIDIPIATAMSNARNAIIVRAADFLIAIGGNYGTLSEIALAKAINKPVYGLETWDIYDLIKVSSAKDFIKRVKNESSYTKG